MAKYDINKFEFYNGKLYYNGFYATRQQVSAYKKLTGHSSAKATTSKPRERYRVGNRWAKMLSINPNSKAGTAKSWAKPLANKNGFIQVGRGNKIIERGGNTYWGANLKSTKRGVVSAGTLLIGSKDWIRHIQMSIHQLQVQAEYFRIAVGYRAQKVFQDSFRFQRFYSAEGQKWASLSAYTLRKRMKRKTSGPILREYGDLLNSIKIEENTALESGTIGTQIYTDKVPMNLAHHKKHTLCYAGWHNEGKGTYGRGVKGRSPKPYKKRQFIGHSSKILHFAAQIQKRYLFDMVFLSKKV